MVSIAAALLLNNHTPELAATREAISIKIIVPIDEGPADTDQEIAIAQRKRSAAAAKIAK
jgi:hypothetical protein